MARSKKIRGVSSVRRGDRLYWFAFVSGKRVACGPGDEGWEKAMTLREQSEAKRKVGELYGIGLDDEARKLEAKTREFPTIAALCNWYMKTLDDRVEEKLRGRRRGKKKVTASTYERRTNHAVHLREILGDDRPASLSVERLREYRRIRRASGAADNTIDGELSTLRAMFRQAVKEKLLRPQDGPGEFPREAAIIPRPRVTLEQYAKILGGAEGDPDFHDFMVCAYETGMRSSEICNLEVGQVRLGEHRIVAGKPIVANYLDLGHDTKTGRPRKVPISPVLLPIVERRIQGKAPGARVFMNGKAPFSKGIVTHRFERLCKRIGLPYGDKLMDREGRRVGMTFHCFKVTRVTTWMEAGFGDELISMAVGTSDLRTLREHYVRMDEGAVMRLVNGGPESHGVRKSATEFRK